MQTYMIYIEITEFDLVVNLIRKQNKKKLKLKLKNQNDSNDIVFDFDAFLLLLKWKLLNVTRTIFLPVHLIQIEGRCYFNLINLKSNEIYNVK